MPWTITPKELFTWREKDPRTRKILEGETNFSFGLQAEISVGLVAGNLIKLSAQLAVNARPPPYFVSQYPELGSSERR